MELKLNYGLQQATSAHSYEITTYVFTPRVLDLTRQSYPSHRFYADAATFIRLTSPVIPLAQLSKKKVIKPWAADIKHEIDRFAEGEGGDVKLAEYNLKLLGCVYKRALADANKHLIHQLSDTSVALSDHIQALNAHVDAIDTALRRLRKVGERAKQIGLPKELQQAWRAIDEYSALITERSLTDIVQQATQLNHDDSELTRTIEHVKHCAVAQYKYRRNNHYDSYAIDGQRNEYLPHRWRVLKRYISSALYLTVEREESGRVLARLIAMGSAGAAMLFATLALLFIQDHWATSLNTFFVTAMVVSYIIKDQIKDLGKSLIGQTLARMSPDHVLTIYGIDQSKIGQCRETFDIVNVSDVPQPIQALRYSDLESHEAIGGRPESVMRHTKTVTINAETLGTQFQGATGLTDVLRFNVHAMLTRMDDEYEQYQYIHPKRHDIIETRCARIYRVNIVLELKDPNHQKRYHRARVVLDKSGIVRVEEVTAKEQDSPTTLAEAS